MSGEMDEEGEVLTMALSQAYQEWEKQTELRGRQQGSQQALLTAVLDALEIRFSTIPAELRERLEALDAEQLRIVHREALTCNDLQSFQQSVGS